MNILDEKYVLVTGGAGYIGSYINEKLCEKGYKTVILDNLSRGKQENLDKGIFIRGDVGDPDVLERVFTEYSIGAVIHTAGSISVEESVKNPFRYYRNNVIATIELLEAMQRHKVLFLLFSSTAVIFGEPQTNLIEESHPINPISPYGKSKAIIESILEDVDMAYGMKYCCLRYFNVAGGDPEGVRKSYQENSSHLIPSVLRIVKEQKGVFYLRGTDYPTPDGTAVRDYIHIDDLAFAHIAALEKLIQEKVSLYYNLGTGFGTSVRQVLTEVEKITGCLIPCVEEKKRVGDAAKYLADPSKAKKELGWEPRYVDLRKIIVDSWNCL